MLVTIITVVYNNEKTIGRAIESVLNQSYDKIEYIVIDGKSKDNTVHIAEKYMDEFLRRGYSYTIISEQDNGMYDALNKGAKMAHGELVGQVNSDDWYEKTAVETMVDLYKKEPYDVAWGSILVHGKRKWTKHAKIGHFWSTSGWCHPAMFSKKDVLLEFPYAVESMYDDFDFITRVHISGKKLVTTDKIISNFSFGEGQSTKRSLAEVRRRVNITYGIYRKYGMSKGYYFYRWLYELVKYITEF